MRYENVAIPAGAAWSSPFAKWQGSLADFSSVDLAVQVTTRALQEREILASEFAGIVLGWTIPQPEIFYGAPTVAARVGADRVSGPMVSQACATSVASVHAAASAVVSGAGSQLVVTTDRTSNGPQMIYPDPAAMGGAPLSTNWVLDSFAQDPWAGSSMLTAGETVASELGISRSELDDVAVLRSEQYSDALADDRVFQRRYMVPVEIPRKRRAPLIVDSDEGVRPVDRESAASLNPATTDGVHTFASQTHPADGTAGAVITTVDRARELAIDGSVVRLLATATARVAPSHMPEAPVPAAEAALRSAGMSMDQIDVVTTHNPFAVNDLYFARHTGRALDKANSYGCSLIFGHPQGPTGLRSITELIEELRTRGGGVGLFTGCAAGDTGAALVLRVDD